MIGRIFFHLFIIFCLIQFAKTKLYPIEFRLPLLGFQPPPGTPWPKPRSINTTERLFSIDPNRLTFTTNLNEENCPVISQALERYKNIILIDPRYQPEPHHTVIENVHVFISNDTDCSYPSSNSSEGYSIWLPHPERLDQATISADSVWGALRALETLSQLIFTNDDHQLLVNQTEIHDFPRYNYRGILLDSARHFLPKRVILANLDAMAMNKFNVFHWHIVDDQSFPFQSQKYPNISEKGAYSKRHVYTTDDIQEIIEYARMRGIRVIPELDTPGHTHAMARAFPDLLTPCYGDGIHPHIPRYPFFSESEVLNPMLNFTFKFMHDMFDEFRHTFKDNYIHLGMDEVSYDCWRSNPEIIRFMRSNGMTDFHHLEQFYIEQTLLMVRDVGYKYLMYQDPVDNGVELSDDSVVIVWKDKYLDSSMDFWQNYIHNVAKRGYKMILSACWYLNYISYPYPGNDWEKYYMCDPRNFSGTDDERDLVIGGEACMWGEFVDGTNLLSRLWPRASAVAERLWSDPEQTQDIDTARLRLDQHRCRMLRRSIPASPILNGYCGDYEWEMNDNIPRPNNGQNGLNGILQSLMRLFR
ncbi:beta-hexosaminidase subunit beta-like [Dermatophagoides pteronyssinus]|uniref:beta-hexosaminidase subunit beta-like n=1 Tax=Dermatophagoides pteronyssinus TaxID=6956 RepID=UPI003F660E8E